MFAPKSTSSSNVKDVEEARHWEGPRHNGAWPAFEDAQYFPSGYDRWPVEKVGNPPAASLRQVRLSAPFADAHCQAETKKVRFEPIDDRAMKYNKVAAVLSNKFTWRKPFGEYSVRHSLARDVCLRLQVGEEERISWITPPLQQDLVDEIQRSKQKVVVLAPFWKKNEVPEEMILKKYYYPIGTKIFGHVEQAVSGSPWPVTAMLLDGSVEPTSTYQEFLPEEKEVTEPQKTRPTSAKRRWRRKNTQEILC
jgi:hypothetical protein